MANSLTNYGKKFKEYIDNRKSQREEQKSAELQEVRQERHMELKNYNQQIRQQALDHLNKKNVEILNNPNIHVSKRIAAVNTLYRDSTKPKLNSSLQEISDHAIITRYNRDLRMKKISEIQRLLKEDKLRRTMQSKTNMNTGKIKVEYYKNRSKALDLIRKIKANKNIRR